MTVVDKMLGSKKIENYRIFFCLSSIGGGGAERVASLLCNHWAGLGAQVTILATAAVRSSGGYELDEEIEVLHLADIVAGEKNKFSRVRAMRRLFKTYTPDVIISFITDVNNASLIGVFGMGIPIIVSERSFPPARINETGTVNSWLRWALYRFALPVVAQTEDVKNWIIENCPGSNVAVIPNPVQFPLPGRDTLDSDDDGLVQRNRLILGSGRLIASKRHDLAIRAFGEIAQDHPDTILVLLGDGPERSQLEQLRDSLGLTNRVILRGQVANAGAWYARADIFVFPSSFEGFPNAVLEALSYGIPTVCFDILTGPRYLIEDHVNGILLPDNDHVTRLGNALSELLGDSGLCRKLSENAVSVRENYSIERISDLWRQHFS